MKNMLCYGIIILALVGWTACAHKPLPVDATGVRVLGKFGTGPGEFNEPFAIAIGKNNSIYVADARNHRIQMFSEAGEFNRCAESRAGTRRSHKRTLSANRPECESLERNA